jgi:hypothetical protein
MDLALLDTQRQDQQCDDIIVFCESEELLVHVCTRSTTLWFSWMAGLSRLSLDGISGVQMAN